MEDFLSLEDKAEIAEIAEVHKRHYAKSKVLAGIALAGILAGYTITAFAPKIAENANPRPSLPRVDYQRQPLERALEIYVLDKNYQETLKSETKKVALTGLGTTFFGLAFIPFLARNRRKRDEELETVKNKYLNL